MPRIPSVSTPPSPRPTAATAGAAAPVRPLATAPELPALTRDDLPSRVVSGTATALVGRVRAQDVSLPRFDLEAAVADPGFAARDPAALPVPAALLATLDRARRVLVVTHVAPDGDAAGSALSVTRALRALGKEVDVVVDDEIPGELRQLDRDHDLKRPADLAHRSWDLALIIDTSVASRIGAVNETLLPHAAALAVVDHHLTDPQIGDFAIAPDAPFVRWMEPDYPAAALLAAAIVGRLESRLRARGADLADILTPALVGFGSDSSWGAIQGLDPNYCRYFKHMLADAGAPTVRGLRTVLDSFLLPIRLVAIATGAKRPDECGLPASLVAELEALEQSGQGLRQQLLPDLDGKPAVGIIEVSRAYLDALTAIGRFDDPEIVPLDILPLFKHDLADQLKQRGAHFIAVLREADNGDVLASFRSESERGAFDLAASLSPDGGGHGQRAGARIRNTSLAAVEAAIVAWARAQGLVR